LITSAALLSLRAIAGRSLRSLKQEEKGERKEKERNNEVLHDFLAA
jgi:hypothetical protein